MTDRSDGDATLSIEQLLTGIGKLIYTLNESVQGIDSRLGKMEDALTAGLDEKLKSIVELLETTNGSLAGISERLEAAAPGASDTAAPAAELDLSPVVEGLKASVEELRTAVETGPGVLGDIDVGLTDLREKMETGFASMAPEGDGGSEVLAGISDSIGAVSGKLDEMLDGTGEIGALLGTTGESIIKGIEQHSSALVEIIEPVREKLIALDDVLINLSEGLKTLGAEGGDGPDPGMLTAELEKITRSMGESAGRLETALAEAVQSSGAQHAELLEDKLRPLVEGVSGIGAGLSSARESLEDRFGEITASTADRVEEISRVVTEKADEQRAALEKMTELLTLHSVELKDSNVRDLNRRAVIFFNNGEYDMAAGVLAEAMELAPESPELHANMAHVQAAQGMLEEAEQSFRKALEADPGLEPAVSGLGTLLVHTGRPDETIEFLKGFLEDRAEPSVDVMLAMSRAYVASGRHSDAIALLEQASQVRPGNPVIESELAKYSEDSGS